MKLVHPEYSFQIEFKEDEIYTVVVENKKEFYKLTNELINQSRGEEGKFVLSNKKILNLKRDLEVITDIYNLDLNSTKSKNKLYKFLNIEKESYMEKMLEIDSKIYEFILSLENDLDLDIDYDLEIDYTNIYKSIDLRFYEESNSFIEKLINYLNVYVDLFNIDNFVLINMKTFLDKNSFKNLFQYKLNKEINLIFIESEEIRFNSKYDKIYIIDKDLSEIY